MNVPGWIIPTLITIWMLIWIYLGLRSGGKLIMQMRTVGGILLSAAVWLIWYLMVETG